MNIQKKFTPRAFALLLALCLTLSLGAPALAASETGLQSTVSGSAEYMLKAVKDPQVGSVGGEWAVIGLARSGCSVPDEYYQNYYDTVEEYVTACKGVLHEKKYTEYSRVILALTAIGKDPADVAGYDLLTPLGDFEKTVWQGVNGPIWALIALDSGNYAMPQNAAAKTQATRQLYIDEILRRQLDGGGWNLTDEGGDGRADPDVTGMALQALAKYQSQEKVKAAANRALTCLSTMQDADGGYTSWGTTNSESVVQVIVALDELGVSLDDTRFVKSGHALLENLLSYRQADGSFLHTSSGSGQNQMSSEQGFYALVSALRAETGKPSLYLMTDALSIGAGGGTDKGAGLPGKNADVKKLPITAPGTTFSDAALSPYVSAIEALAARGVVGGYPDGSFGAEKNMTRAEYCAIVVRGLGLTPAANGKFADIKSGDWFSAYVGTANAYGVVNGTSATTFDPNGTITRQEAAAMVARAAKLCGMDTELTAGEIRDILAPFGDYISAAAWSQGSLAFCYKAGILDDSVLTIEPTEAITRGELTNMLYQMLTAAKLI